MFHGSTLFMHNFDKHMIGSLSTQPPYDTIVNLGFKETLKAQRVKTRPARFLKIAFCSQRMELPVPNT